MGDLTLDHPTPEEYLAMSEDERENECDRSLARLRAVMRQFVVGEEEEDGE